MNVNEFDSFQKNNQKEQSNTGVGMEAKCGQCTLWLLILGNRGFSALAWVKAALCRLAEWI